MIGGTILARIGASVAGKAAHLDFSIRPAGRGAPNIDPKPILDGWKLLEATAIYRASGRNVLYGKDRAGAMSIGQIMLLPKPLLEKRVLSDERIEVYECGRDDIHSGQIDRRVLATLAYLAESGLRPTVTSLKCGHGFYTASGNVSHHSSGNAVDIAMVNGIPILGHQEAGGITEQTVRRLMQLQGTMAPAQIISLFEIGGTTISMGDHADHIHVGFQPMFGANKKLGRQALAVLEPGQWSDLISRLGEIENPVVPTKPSKYSLPAKKRVQPRPRRRVDRRAPKARSASSSSSSGSSSARPTGATSCRPAADALVESVLVLTTLGAPERRRLGGAAGAPGLQSRARARADHARDDRARRPPFPSAEDAAEWLSAADLDDELEAAVRHAQSRSPCPSRRVRGPVRDGAVSLARPCRAGRLRQRRRAGRRALRRRARGAGVRAAASAAVDGGAGGALRRAPGRPR